MAQTISATDTEVQKPVNALYQQMLLRNARPVAPYFIGTTPGVLSKNSGTATIMWRRFNTSLDNASGPAPSTTALTELTTTASYMQGRDSITAHFSNVTATVSKYGQFFILNEEVDIYNPNGTMAGITRTLAIVAGRSIDYLQREIAESGMTAIRAGNVASDGVIVSKITSTALQNAIITMSTNAAMPFTPMSEGSGNIGTNPVLPAYWSICHPHVAYDVSQLPGFKSVETYAGQVDTVPGEFGLYSGAGFAVRFIQTPDASADANLGGSLGSTGLRSTGGSVIDLYRTVVYGQDCIGSVGLGQACPDGIFRAGDDVGVIEMLAAGRAAGQGATTSDPYNEISTLAYKVFHTGAVLNTNFGRVIHSGATNVTA